MNRIFAFFKKKEEKKKLPEHLAVGKFGEDAAVKYLKRKKYEIVDRNVHAGRSELDIVALKDDTLVFFEVKTRVYGKEDYGKEDFSRPADAVNKEKATYLIRGAYRYIKDNKNFVYKYYKRFDLIEVYAERRKNRLICREIKHFENAIRRG